MMEETEKDKVADRLDVEELSALTWALQVYKAGRSKSTIFPGNLTVVYLGKT